jgi:hypothetical protein
MIGIMLVKGVHHCRSMKHYWFHAGSEGAEHVQNGGIATTGLRSPQKACWICNC